MKKIIKLTESELVSIIKKVISEQPDSKMPFQIEKFGYKQGDPSTVKPALEKQSELVKNADPDIAVDMVSAALDGIPGIGNLVSASIDIIHSLTYFGRMIMTIDLGYKIENALLGIITLATVSAPVAGNLTNIVARQGIKNFLKRTPPEIAKMLGINVGMVLKKSAWKYCIVAFLIKVFRNQTASQLADVKEKIDNCGLNVKSEISSLLQELIDMTNECNPDYREIDKLDKI